jgi:hypothetical protein
VLVVAFGDGKFTGEILDELRQLRSHDSDEEEWYIPDAIPEGSSAAIALIEHRWAIPLRDAILRAGGQAVADAWLHPRDLVAVGLAGDD